MEIPAFVKRFTGEITRLGQPEDEDYEEVVDTIEEDFPRAEARESSREFRRESRREEPGREYSREERKERKERRSLAAKDSAGLEWEKERASQKVPVSEGRSRLRTAVQLEEEKHGSSSLVNFKASSMQQVIVMKPKDFSECRAIADYLCGKFTILLNMQDTEEASVQRIVDFIAGVAYANDGRMTMLSDTFYLVTPFTVNLISEIVGGLEEQGIFYQT